MFVGLKPYLRGFVSDRNVHSHCKQLSRTEFRVTWRESSVRPVLVAAPPVRGVRQQNSPPRMELVEGDKAPDFYMPTDQGAHVSLKELTGRPVVLYFYPKANTPGCTTQACDLRDNIEALNQVQAVVIGVSRDPVADLAKFRKDHRLNFYLASDADGLVTEAYGVWKLRKMMGREFMGIERSTFIIKDGVIKKVWRGVKAAEHLDWVKRSLEELKMSAL